MRFAAIASLVLTGCFYIAPIETHPTVTIEPAPGDVMVPVFRGSAFTVSATLDPQHQPGTFQWSATACASLVNGRADACDSTPFYAGPAAISDSVQLMVPITTHDSNELIKAIRVQLTARDDRGALAVGGDQVEYAVADAAPTLVVSSSAHSYTVGAPIQLFAQYSDPDGPASGVTLDWMVTAPNPLTLTGGQPISGGGAMITVGLRLVPDVPGPWLISVTARDAAGMSVVQPLSFTVLPDQPPCLIQTQPVVPPDGAVLEVSEPTRFAVVQVTDDLDAYPPLTTDSAYGTTAFAWSILPPGGSVHQPLVGATGNAIDFDPSAYTPGRIVELRVDIADRKHALPAPPTCADGEATCPALPASCIQRQTWRVEVR